MYVCSTHTIFERTEAHLVAFIEIAFISILSRRLARIATQEISAQKRRARVPLEFRGKLFKGFPHGKMNVLVPPSHMGEQRQPGNCRWTVDAENRAADP